MVKMSFSTQNLGKFLALVSFATLLTLQVTHSPLAHIAAPCCQSSQSEEHSHHHTHSHECSHSHSHSHGIEDEADESHHSCPTCPDDDSCQLCEFLAQSANPVTILVTLEGADVVYGYSERSESLFFDCQLGGPHVRGPPVSA